MFGDGHITKPNKKGTVEIKFSSTVKSIIDFKARLLGSNVISKPQHKKAYGSKLVHHTCKRVKPENMDKIYQINQLSQDDFWLWLLDDGSFHKTKRFYNLNSHCLTRAENIELSWYLWHSLGIETRVYFEKKKDGRLFWYQYIPRAQAESLIPEFKEFIKLHNLIGYEYKVGETSQTI